jgi:hypothetical protein
MTSTVDESESDDNSADQTFENNGCASLTKPMGHTGNVKTGVAPRNRRPRAPQRRDSRGRFTAKRLKLRGKARLYGGMTLELAAKEYIWLWDLRHGVAAKTIAIVEGISVRRVQAGAARARAQERPCPTETAVRPPPLVPFFPIGPFNPDSRCGHNRPIQAGSVLCCMVCHCSGMDDHPALKRNPLTDPAPEPKPPPAPKAAARETRKQRRQKIYGIHP